MTDATSNLHVHSLKMIQVTQHAKDTDENTVIGNATAFLCCYNSKIYLVTNYHVVSGRRYDTDEVIDSKFAIPGCLSFIVTVRVRATDGNYKHADVSGKTSYYDDDNCPNWLEHPAYYDECGEHCDVMAIPFNAFAQQAINKGCEGLVVDINRDLNNEIKLRVMDELFITGFPLKIANSLSKYPIYKAGFLASEPEDSHSGEKFYVDAKTKPGMSGAPVIQKERLSIIPGAGGTLVCSEGKINLVGIYSGRTESASDEYTAKLGIVWPFRQFRIPILESDKSI